MLLHELRIIKASTLVFLCITLMQFASAQTLSEDLSSGTASPSPFSSNETRSNNLFVDGTKRLAINPGAFSSAAGAHMVYTNDFESEVGDEWSHQARSTTPKGNRQFLGHFGPEIATLVLRDLPEHRLLRISFDLFIIKTWDGSHVHWGPDIWQLSLVNGPTLVRTTFNNCVMVNSNEQTYPDNYPFTSHPGWTGSKEHQSLGYEYLFGQPWGDKPVQIDSVYRIEAVVPHSSDKIAFQFAAFCNDEKLKDQSWGIDNIQVESFAASKRLAEKELEACWHNLSGSDPVKAIDSLWKMVAAADQTTDFLVRQLGNKVTHEDRARLDQVRSLVNLIRHGRRSSRAQGVVMLSQLGPVALPVIREELNQKNDPDTQLAFAKALVTISKQTDKQETLAKRRQVTRARRILDIIDSPQARQLSWQLAAPSNTEKSLGNLDWQLH